MKVAVVPNLTRERAMAVTEDACRRLKELGVDFAFDVSLKDSLRRIDGAGFESEPSLYGERVYVTVGSIYL